MQEVDRSYLDNIDPPRLAAPFDEARPEFPDEDDESHR
jgi:hypothetical protein